MIIGIDCGHTLSNNIDYGASGIREESNLTREVGSRVIKMFKSKGHEVVDCTVDICTGSLNDSLSRRYNKANENNCDYFISIHFNAFNGSASGTEILYCSNTDDKMERILNKFVSLGLSNRGLKQRSELAVLKHTNMSAMLIECAFCDSEEDMRIYDADIFAEAIVEGFLGEEVDGVISYQSEVNVTQNTQSVEQSPIAKAKEFVGDRCAELQQKLIAKGYDCGGYGADGSFGLGTYDSLIQFQKNNNIECDGLAGDKTFAKLQEIVQGISSQIQGSDKVLRLQIICNQILGIGLEEDGTWGNLTNSAVQNLPLCGVDYTQPILTKWIQFILGINCDGVFLYETERYLKEFQSNQGNLTVDGICGFNSYKALALS